MLTQIRERATGWLAWVIVILITIPFALWGIQSYFEGPAGRPRGHGERRRNTPVRLPERTLPATPGVRPPGRRQQQPGAPGERRHAHRGGRVP